MLSGVGNEFRISQSTVEMCRPAPKKVHEPGERFPIVRFMNSVASIRPPSQLRPQHAPCAGAGFFGAASFYYQNGIASFSRFRYVGLYGYRSGNSRVGQGLHSSPPSSDRPRGRIHRRLMVVAWLTGEATSIAALFQPPPCRRAFTNHCHPIPFPQRGMDRSH
jgi:hypothetical protein